MSFEVVVHSFSVSNHSLSPFKKVAECSDNQLNPRPVAASSANRQRKTPVVADYSASKPRRDLVHLELLQGALQAVYLASSRTQVVLLEPLLLNKAVVCSALVVLLSKAVVLDNLQQAAVCLQLRVARLELLRWVRCRSFKLSRILKVR